MNFVKCFSDYELCEMFLRLWTLWNVSRNWSVNYFTDY